MGLRPRRFRQSWSAALMEQSEGAVMKQQAQQTHAPVAVHRRTAEWLRAALDLQLARVPLLVEARAYLRLLRLQRAQWPWLLPLLMLTALRAYQRERRRLRQQAAAALRQPH
jgi:hypothetical protein